MCPNPTAIEAQTLDGVEARNTGEKISNYSPSVGFVCKKEDQPDGRCLDYRARYCCPGNISYYIIHYNISYIVSFYFVSLIVAVIVFL